MPEISKSTVPEHRGVLARRMPSVFISYSHVAAKTEHGQNVLSRTVKVLLAQQLPRRFVRTLGARHCADRHGTVIKANIATLSDSRATVASRMAMVDDEDIVATKIDHRAHQ
jgi:hypothetical protein